MEEIAFVKRVMTEIRPAFTIPSADGLPMAIVGTTTTVTLV
jgi:hypothetical protein